jgi:type VI secretion system protein VasJ
MLDSLSRYPEVNNAETLRIAGALLLAERAAEGAIPGSLYQALEIRLQQSGGPDAVVPQNVSGESHTSPAMTGSVPSLTGIASGRAAGAGAGTGGISEKPAGRLVIRPPADKKLAS